MKTTLQILQDARALISDPQDWCVGHLLLRLNGRSKRCALGAVGAASDVANESQYN